MDLINELELMNTKGIDGAINQVKEQKDLWDKKLHVLNALNLINALEELAKENFFEKHGIAQMRLYTIIHYSGTSIKFGMFDDNSKQLQITDEEANTIIYEQLERLFCEFDGFNSHNIKGDFDIFLNAKGNIRKNILDNILSEELQKTLKYSEMQMDIPQKEESINKRPKI
jgi:hypothetical protein